MQAIYLVSLRLIRELAMGTKQVGVCYAIAVIKMKYNDIYTLNYVFFSGQLFIW